MNLVFDANFFIALENTNNINQLRDIRTILKQENMGIYTTQSVLQEVDQGRLPIEKVKHFIDKSEPVNLSEPEYRNMKREAIKRGYISGEKGETDLEVIYLAKKLSEREETLIVTDDQGIEETVTNILRNPKLQIVKPFNLLSTVASKAPTQKQKSQLLLTATETASYFLQHRLRAGRSISPIIHKILETTRQIAQQTVQIPALPPRINQALQKIMNDEEPHKDETKELTILQPIPDLLKKLSQTEDPSELENLTAEIAWQLAQKTKQLTPETHLPLQILTQQKMFQAQIRAAAKNLEQGKPQEAQKNITNALGLYPAHTPENLENTLTLMAIIQLANQEIEKAQNTLNQILEQKTTPTPQTKQIQNLIQAARGEPLPKEADPEYLLKAAQDLHTLGNIEHPPKILEAILELEAPQITKTEAAHCLLNYCRLQDRELTETTMKKLEEILPEEELRDKTKAPLDKALKLENFTHIQGCPKPYTQTMYILQTTEQQNEIRVKAWHPTLKSVMLICLPKKCSTEIANATTIKITSGRIKTNLNIVQIRENKVRAIIETTPDTQIQTTKRKLQIAAF
ncbi:MAG: tetratricopeptide repeat protein [Candidatus Jordarchaeaceae archaeon]